MPDYAGAVAAIREKLEADWTTTPIAFQNEAQPALEGVPAWVYCEIVQNGSELHTVGTPGSRSYIDFGLISLHVFVATNQDEGEGINAGLTYAGQLSEIFRNERLYTGTSGYEVRTGLALGASDAPSISGGDSASDDGLWFGFTVNIPFQYWHLG